MSDAGRERIVDGGVAERAGHPHSREVVVRVHLTDDTDDGAKLQQRDRRCGIIEVHLPRLEIGDE